MVQASMWSRMGSAVGTDEFTNASAHKHTDNWRKELQYLAQIAKTKPHAAHAALTPGLRGRWTHVMHTLVMPEAAQLALDDPAAE